MVSYKLMESIYLLVKMNFLIRYAIYTLLYVPIEIIFILLLVNFIIYNIIVFIINTYYYVTQSEKRRNGELYEYCMLFYFT